MRSVKQNRLFFNWFEAFLQANTSHSIEIKSKRPKKYFTVSFSTPLMHYSKSNIPHGNTKSNINMHHLCILGYIYVHTKRFFNVTWLLCQFYGLQWKSINSAFYSLLLNRYAQNSSYQMYSLSQLIT